MLSKLINYNRLQTRRNIFIDFIVKHNSSIWSHATKKCRKVSAHCDIPYIITIWAFLFTFFPHWLCFCAGPFSVCRLIRRSSIQGVQGETHIETKQFSSARVVALFLYTESNFSTKPLTIGRESGWKTEWRMAREWRRRNIKIRKKKEERLRSVHEKPTVSWHRLFSPGNQRLFFRRQLSAMLSISARNLKGARYKSFA